MGFTGAVFGPDCGADVFGLEDFGTGAECLSGAGCFFGTGCSVEECLTGAGDFFSAGWSVGAILGLVTVAILCFGTGSVLVPSFGWLDSELPEGSSFCFGTGPLGGVCEAT